MQTPASSAMQGKSSTHGPAISSTRLAIPWVAGWLVLTVVMAVAGRQATLSLGVFQVMEVRSILGLVLLYPLVRVDDRLRAMHTARPALHLVRNVVHYGAQYAWLYALTLIPLAQVVALEFTMPIWTVLLAAAFLGEPLHRWKVAAVALGVTGVAMIVQPTHAAASPGQLIALAAAAGFAVSAPWSSCSRATSTPPGSCSGCWLCSRCSACGLRWPPGAGRCLWCGVGCA